MRLPGVQKFNLLSVAGRNKGLEGSPPRFRNNIRFEVGKCWLKAKAREVIRQVPEVRQAKVAALRQAISEGAYVIEVREVSRQLLVNLLMEKLR